jgi:hypothetical protein
VKLCDGGSKALELGRESTACKIYRITPVPFMSEEASIGSGAEEGRCLEPFTLGGGLGNLLRLFDGSVCCALLFDLEVKSYPDFLVLYEVAKLQLCSKYRSAARLVGEQVEFGQPALKPPLIRSQSLHQIECEPPEPIRFIETSQLGNLWVVGERESDDSGSFIEEGHPAIGRGKRPTSLFLVEDRLRPVFIIIDLQQHTLGRHVGFLSLLSDQKDPASIRLQAKVLNRQVRVLQRKDQPSSSETMPEISGDQF